MTKASICTIGDEILIGQIVDTNSSEIARALGSIGVRISTMESIGDDRDQIVGKISSLLKDNDIVISTGGLGPTRDDITKDALAELSGSTCTQVPSCCTFSTMPVFTVFRIHRKFLMFSPPLN